MAFAAWNSHPIGLIGHMAMRGMAMSRTREVTITTGCGPRRKTLVAGGGGGDYRP